MPLPASIAAQPTNKDIDTATAMGDFFDLPLGEDASLPYAAIAAGGPPSRPLEFPAPTVDRAIVAPADVVDRRTGHAFRATSVLMRRPLHARGCASRALPPANANAGGHSSFDSARSRHRRTMTPDRIQAWHPAFNAPSSSLAADKKQHRRAHSHTPAMPKLPPCEPSCHLPDKAYMVRRKICSTTHGSIRLCVVLKRLGRNGANNARAVISEQNGFDSWPRPSAKHDERVLDPEWETTDEMVAIKVVNWSKLNSLRGRHMEDPVKELAALQQLLGSYHPNVIPILDALQDEMHLFCVFPYIAGGDLCGRLLDEMASSPTGRIDESLARTWFRQILAAVGHLQKKGVCHRDLSQENMVVDEDNNIRLVDFGLSLRVPYADPNNRKLATDVSANTQRRLMKAQGQCGSLEYMAPEVSSQSEAFDGFAIDLWAAGIVLFELLVGKKPFGMSDPVDKNFRIIALDGDLEGLLRAKGIEMDHEAVDLLQNMLRCDPARRLTLAEIAEHPWVQGGVRRPEMPVEDDGLVGKWFLKNKSLDDLDDTKPPSVLLASLVDDYSCSRTFTSESMASLSSTIESMPSTVGTVDEEPQARLPHKSDDASRCPLPPSSAVADVDVAKKRNWLAFRLKPMKWRRADKAAAML